VAGVVAPRNQPEPVSQRKTMQLDVIKARSGHNRKMDAPVKKKSPNTIDKFVGSRVRMRRTMLGLNQTRLAEPLGVTYQQVQKYESGTSRIGAGRLQHIAQILQVSVSYFFEGAPSVSNKAQDKNSTGHLPDYAAKFIETSEGLAIAKSFMLIGDAGLRHCVVKILESMAHDAEK